MVRTVSPDQMLKRESPVLQTGIPSKSNMSCSMGFLTAGSTSQSLPKAGLKFTCAKIISSNDIISVDLRSYTKINVMDSSITFIMNSTFIITKLRNIIQTIQIYYNILYVTKYYGVRFT